VFRGLDWRREGAISADEFVQRMAELHIPVSREEVDRMTDVLDFQLPG